MPPALDAALLERWADAAVAVLERHAGTIDRINVFPVADRDTGTNLLLTMQAAAAERAGVPTSARRATGGGSGPAVAAAEALARGALGGARGNSGVVLSQVLRGVAEAVAAADAAGDTADGAVVLADALTRAVRLATDAVSRPREGTVLTVLAAAAAAARVAADPAGRRTSGTGGADGVRSASPTAIPSRSCTERSGPDGSAAGVPRRDVSDTAALDDVAVAAADAAGTALLATTAQLPELARARVVDAGGLGLHLVLDALAVLLTGRAAAVPRASAGTAAPSGDPTSVAPPAVPPGASSRGPGYEVMYRLDGSDAARVTVLRAALDALGTSVAVVGDGSPGGAGTWTVHVHCADIGAVLEAGMAAGRPHAVRITPLVERPDGTGEVATARALVVLARVPEVAALAREAGAEVLVCGPGADPPGADAAVDHPALDHPALDHPSLDHPALDRVLTGAGARLVILLPCDAGLVPVAERAASIARRAGRETVVVPAASAVAGLAALAVHDPARHPADDVVAMTEAAAGTRTGVLLVAGAEALTWAGRCRPGDVLGLVDGEVVLIAPDVPVGALWLASRMVTAGGELVTVLLGAGVADELGEGLAVQLHRSHPEVDVVVHRGARPGALMEVGVE